MSMKILVLIGLLVTIFLIKNQAPTLLQFNIFNQFNFGKVTPKTEINETSTYNFYNVGELTNTKEPAFVQIFQNKEGQNELWVSEFTGNPIAHGIVEYYNLDTNSFLKFNAQFVWPNLMNKVQGKSLGLSQDEVVLVGDGFLVPFKNTGSVTAILDVTNQNSQTLSYTKPNNGYFYHDTRLIDMNNDGRLDILTARATFDSFSKKGKGQLLWLEQPASGQEKGQWTEHVLGDMAEVLFEVRSYKDSQSQILIYAADFFTNRMTLTLYNKLSQKVEWTRNFDTKLVGPYSMNFVDLDNDGKVELMINTHEADKGGSIYAYVIPSDSEIQTAEFTRYTIASDLFKVTAFGQGQAAPGFVFPIYPNKQKIGKEKPSLLVAGDGSQRIHYFEPKQGEQFGYDEKVQVYYDAIIGYIAYYYPQDSNFLRFYIPCYGKDSIFVYDFVN